MEGLKKYDTSEIHIITGRKGFLGKGGFGVVRLGHHAAIDWIAIKQCHLYGSPDAIDKARSM